jgi:hypothetical protein
MNKIISRLKTFVEFIKKQNSLQNNRPIYKLVEVIKEADNYIAVIKIVNKNIVFQIKPEEVLGNDDLVDQFSQRDIRALTYLGYLGIHSPRYKILAKKCLENEKILFVLSQKGDKRIIAKTADQILNEKDIINSMTSEDAKVIGYTVASESFLQEKSQKEALLNNISQKSNILKFCRDE